MSVILSPSRRPCPLPLGFPRRSPTTRVLPNLPSPVRRPSWPLLEPFHRHRTRGPEVKSQACVCEQRHGLRPILPWSLCRYARQSRSVTIRTMRSEVRAVSRSQWSLDITFPREMRLNIFAGAGSGTDTEESLRNVTGKIWTMLNCPRRSVRFPQPQSFPNCSSIIKG